MACVRDVVLSGAGQLWYSTYDDRPSKLFDGMHHARLAILLAERQAGASPTILTTRYHKWYAVERDSLFEVVSYLPVTLSGGAVVPKFRAEVEVGIFRKLSKLPKRIGDTISPTETNHNIFYKITGVGHWFTFTHNAPKFWRNGVAGQSTRESSASFSSAVMRDTIFCCLNSSLHYWIYQALTNCRDFNPSDLRYLPLTATLASGVKDFVRLSSRLMKRLEETAETGSGNYEVGGAVKYQRFKPKTAKPIIDEIDELLAKHYGLTAEELDFIVNYDIKYQGWSARRIRGRRMIENNPTNVSSAFEMLLEEVEAEIDFVNGVGAKGFGARDYDKAKEALRAREFFTAFRDRLATLRKEWGELAAAAERDEDEETRAERQHLGKLRKGLRTPESAYYRPILQVLEQIGGSGKVSDVLNKVGQMMKPILKEVDNDPLASGPDNTLWRNAAQWARNSMVRDALLKADSLEYGRSATRAG